MVQKRARKKSVGMRGSRTSGYGSHKKHRGGGSRGGRGMAGMKKHKKTWMAKNAPNSLGKRGFKSLRQRKLRKEQRTLNVSQIEMLANGSKEIDVSKLGYSRVLGGGEISSPVHVKAGYFTEKARQKIEAAKGKAIPLSGSKDESG